MDDGQANYERAQLAFDQEEPDDPQWQLQEPTTLAGRIVQWIAVQSESKRMEMADMLIDELGLESIEQFTQAVEDGGFRRY
jgi:hypothetical protein